MLGLSSKFLPFEAKIFEAIARALPSGPSELMSKQLAVVNKVQRLLEWNEIEFYCMRWFRVRWLGERTIPAPG